VLALQVLFLLNQPEVVLREVHRVLRPGGLLITHGPDSKNEVYTPDLIGKMRAVYGAVLKESGFVEWRVQGWSPSALYEHYQTFFSSVTIIDDERLAFRFTCPAGWVYARLAARFTAFQIAVPEDIHQQALVRIRQCMADEYGADWVEIVITGEARHTLAVYTKA
jgi:SAM-dependent methyltransferase